MMGWWWCCWDAACLSIVLLIIAALRKSRQPFMADASSGGPRPRRALHGCGIGGRWVTTSGDEAHGRGGRASASVDVLGPRVTASGLGRRRNALITRGYGARESALRNPAVARQREELLPYECSVLEANKRT